MRHSFFCVAFSSYKFIKLLIKGVIHAVRYGNATPKAMERINVSEYFSRQAAAHITPKNGANIILRALLSPP